MLTQPVSLPPQNCDNCLAPVLVLKSATVPAGAAPSQTLHQRRSRPLGSVPPAAGSKRQMPTEASVFKLTSDFAILAHLTRAIRPPGTTDQSFARRVGTVTTEDPSTFHYEDGARLFSQGFVSTLPSGKLRYALVLLQKNDYYLSGKYEPASIVIGFRGQIATLENLDVGLYTVVWEADAPAA